MASKHIQHAANPMKALYSTFIQPTLSTSRTTTRTVRPQWSNQYASQQTPSHQTRAFTTTHSRLAQTNNNKKSRAPEMRTQKWNEEIKARIIQLVDPETERLEEPVTRFDVLKNLDLKTYRLVQLTPDDPDDRNAIPVCKIIHKAENYQAEKRKKAAQKESKQIAAKERSVKTLELNWAIDGNDLGHRLNKVRGFLGEGRRVEVVLASKKKGRKATPAECEEVLHKIRQVADGVPGARESKPMDGKVGGLVTLTFQGKASVAPKEQAQGGQDGGAPLAGETADVK